VYLDSSALFKLVFEEDETGALARFLRDWPTRVSSGLARVEVTRIAARFEDDAVLRETRTLFRRLDLIRVNDAVMATAATLEPLALRSPDAIHLATALSLGHQLAGMVVYDRRLADAARHHGLTVWAPA
jgi:hypothetical protein